MSTLVMHLFPTHRARLAALTTLMTGLAALCPARTTAQGVYMRKDADGKVTFSNAPTGTGFQSSPELSRSAGPVVRDERPAGADDSAVEANGAPSLRQSAPPNVVNRERRRAEEQARQNANLQQWIEALEHPHPKNRLEAIRHLSHMGAAAGPAIAKLSETVQDVEQERGVRNEAFIALTRIAPHDPCVVQLAVVCIGEGDEVIGGNALNFLKTRSRQVAPALLLALKSENEHERTAAAQLLGESPVVRDADLPATVVPALVLALGDQSPAVRQRAVNALGAFKNQSSEILGPLIAALDDRDIYVQRGAAAALAGFGATAAPAIPALAKKLRTGVDHETRMQATTALRMIDTPESAQEIERYLRQREVVKK